MQNKAEGARDQTRIKCHQFPGIIYHLEQFTSCNSENHHRSQSRLHLRVPKSHLPIVLYIANRILSALPQRARYRSNEFSNDTFGSKDVVDSFAGSQLNADKAAALAAVRDVLYAMLQQARPQAMLQRPSRWPWALAQAMLPDLLPRRSWPHVSPLRRRRSIELFPCPLASVLYWCWFLASQRLQCLLGMALGRFGPIFRS
jgi:hypothetical protein